MEKSNSWTENICEFLNYGAALCVFLAMAVSVANIFMRVAFKSPLLGTIELVSIFSAIGVALALAYSAYYNAQIEVSFFVDKMPRLGQKIIGIAINLISLAFWAIAAYYLFLSGQDIDRNNLMTATLHIPIYPIICIITMGIAALCLVMVAKIIDLVRMETNLVRMETK